MIRGTLKVLLSAFVLMLFSSSFAIADGTNFYWSSKSYGRGVGTAGTISGCTAGLQEQNGLCYQACRDGYRGEGPVCWSREELSYGRGAGRVPNIEGHCRGDYGDKDGGLCYKDCRSGYDGKGPVCWLKNASYGRGAGQALKLSCPGGKVLDAGLCYDNCRDGYRGVGPVCWGEPPTGYVFCGLGFAKSESICGTLMFSQTLAGLLLASDIGGFAKAAAAAKAPKLAKVIESEKIVLGGSRMTQAEKVAGNQKAYSEMWNMGQEFSTLIVSAIKSKAWRDLFSNPKFAALMATYRTLSHTHNLIKLEETKRSDFRNDEDYALAQIRLVADGLGMFMMVIEARDLIVGSKTLWQNDAYQFVGNSLSAISAYAWPAI